MAHLTPTIKSKEPEMDIARWLGYTAVGFVIWIAIFSFAVKMI